VVEVKGEKMRKAITILVLMFVLCSSLSSCKRQKETAKVDTPVESKKEVKDKIINKNPTLPRRSLPDFLFMSKQFESTQIIKLNTRNKSKQVVNNLPYSPKDIIISPDGKRLAFHTYSDRNNGNSFDIYTMDTNGNDLHLTNQNFHLTYTEKGSRYPEYIFAPDSKQLIILDSTKVLNQEEIVYIVANDGSANSQYSSSQPEYTIYQELFEILKVESSLKTMTTDSGASQFGHFFKFNPLRKEYLILRDRTIGVFTWETKNFTPLFTSTDLITQYTWDSAYKNIFYLSNKNETYDLHYFDPVTQKSQELDASSYQFYPKDLVCLNKIRYESYDKKPQFFTNQPDLTFYDLETKQTSLIPSKYAFGGSKIINNQYLFFIRSPGKSDRDFLYLYDCIKKTKLDLTEMVDLINCLDVKLYSNSLYIFHDFGMIKYDLPSKKVTYIPEPDFMNHYSGGSVFYRYSIDNSQILVKNVDTVGIIDQKFQLTQVCAGLFKKNREYYNSPDRYEDRTFFWVSLDEVIYFEHPESKTDLLYFDAANQQTKNLTKEIGNVVTYQVSPDHYNVAFLVDDPINRTNDYSVYITSLVDFQRVKITTFTVLPGMYESFPRNFDFYHFFPLCWTNNSQKLYFNCLDLSEGLLKFYRIKRVDADGKNLSTLYATKIPLYQIQLSPDNQRIVFISDYKQEVAILDIASGNVEVISNLLTKQHCIYPSWSPNEPWIIFYYEENVFYENSTKVDDVTQICVLSINGRVIKQLISKMSIMPLGDLLYPMTILSPQRNIYVYFDAIQEESSAQPPDLVVVYPSNEKQTIKHVTHGYKWAEDGNSLLFIRFDDSAKKNTVSVFDCTKKSLTDVSRDVQQLYDAIWSLDGKQILYAGTDSKTGQIVFKTAQSDGTNQKVLFTLGENPLERPSSIEKIEKLVWLR
jgi:Tol biopolymer transport system component